MKWVIILPQDAVAAGRKAAAAVAGSDPVEQSATLYLHSNYVGM